MFQKIIIDSIFSKIALNTATHLTAWCLKRDGVEKYPELRALRITVTHTCNYQINLKYMSLTLTMKLNAQDTCQKSLEKQERKCSVIFVRITIASDVSFLSKSTFDAELCACCSRSSKAYMYLSV